MTTSEEKITEIREELEHQINSLRTMGDEDDHLHVDEVYDILKDILNSIDKT